MSESQEQGISRRDLLKRGAALGGAVVWATPVVQTLGMGRAFAQTASPVGGKDISYIGINVEGCEVNGAPFFVKWEDGAGWEDSPGAAPSCEDKENLPSGVPGDGKGFDIQSDSIASCRDLWVPSEYSECTVTVWVKAGTTCRTYTNADINFGGWTTVCSAVT
jgi:hypothetical protein